MDGHCEGIQKKKARTRMGCDVGCQTDQSTSSTATPNSGFPQQQQQPSTVPQSSAPSQSAATISNAAVTLATLHQRNVPGNTAVTEWAKENSGTSSASASGASTPGAGASSSPASSLTTQADNKKLTGPAGVKPNEIEAYFGEKKPPATTNSATSTTTSPVVVPLAVPPGQTQQQLQQQQQQQKTRAASTTGVLGEAKKQVRNSVPPLANGNAVSTPNQVAASSSNTPAKADGPSWNDENCKLRLVINRFSHLEETMCSPPKSIEGVSWKIMVMPKQHMVQKKQQKCMGFFLQCAPERAYSDQWSVHAVADMRMISYKPNVPHFARRTTHTYTSKENDWGYSCFMTWADIIDEAQGYIRDDTVVLEIAVKAEPPKNMMTHEDFLDKIEKWIVLADMQMKKGNIDLALEANQSAMKFCKGKDDVCYQRLETQRETFVNAKLFESIERIEKGPVVCTDTTHGKPTSLRQALTGAQKSLNGKMTAKGGKKTRAVVTVQHMKKKKPYDTNNTTQNRGQNPAAVAKELKSKEECDIERDEQTDSDESRGEKAGIGSDEEDDQEFDDEEYNEGDYQDQADECSTLGGEFGSSGSGTAAADQDIGEDGDVETNYDDEEDRGSFGSSSYKADQDNDDVDTCDRMIQTDFEDIMKSVLGDSDLYDDVSRRAYILNSVRNMIESGETDDRLLAETVLTRFSGPDAESTRVDLISFHDKMGFAANPQDDIETVFGVDGIDEEETFPQTVLESLPGVMAHGGVKGHISTTNMAERMIKSWLDVEGSLFSALDPDGMIAHLSVSDREALIDELSFKMQPLVSTLDCEFRETVHLARNFLITTRNALDDSNKMAAECEDIKKVFEERLTAKLNTEVVKRPVEISKKTVTTSAAATSAAGTKAVNHGRPTVIAKRSMKQVLPADAVIADLKELSGDKSEGRVQEDGQNMRDVQIAFKRLNGTMTPMITQIGANNRKVQRMFAELLSENGSLPAYLKDLTITHNAQRVSAANEIKVVRDSLNAVTDEKSKLEKLVAEKEKALIAETERHLKTQKETKDIKNQLKKSESKATKEENRAVGLQVQVNELDEKAKLLRKELETLKKKSAEERAKVKKDKERDTQTIRQQSIEISERENERDKAKKEVDDVNRVKDKVEKEKKAIAAQLAAMAERARTGEAAVIESRGQLAMEEMKKRKEAVQNGYTETELLANRVRQVTDRDIMRKSLAEWKSALDKCDTLSKSLKADYDHAVEQIKSGAKTLAQTAEIKLPPVDPLPKLVKPPPVQVVAPSASVIPPPIMPPTPAAGVIGQQRSTPIGRPADPSSACSTPTRSRGVQQRVPSPVKSVTRSDDAPSSLWSWNTIGNLGDLRPSSQNDFNSSMDSLQRDIWAANGNGNGSLGTDFLRTSSGSTMSNQMNNSMNTAPQQAPSPFIRPTPQQQQQQQQSAQQSQYANQQSQMQQQQQNNRIQQQQSRGYGDMWSQQPSSAQQEYGNARMMAHNGGGDLTSGGYAPWHQPSQQAQQQQLRGGGQQQPAHHSMFQSHSFFDNGM